MTKIVSRSADFSFWQLSFDHFAPSQNETDFLANGVQEKDNVIPLRPFCAFPINAAFRKSSLSRPFVASPNVNATNTWAFSGHILGNMSG